MLNQSARYFVPDPSHWPILGSAALLSMASGAALWMNEATWGKFVLIAGVCMLFLMMFGWFGSVARDAASDSSDVDIWLPLMAPRPPSAARVASLGDGADKFPDPLCRHKR